MRRYRYSLASLFGFVTAVAFICAFVRWAPEVIAFLAVMIAMFLFSLAVCAVSILATNWCVEAIVGAARLARRILLTLPSSMGRKVPSQVGRDGNGWNAGRSARLEP
jgi:hypothetical protein